MQMTDEEIRRSYRQAANPRKQINVLAELNLCDTRTIKNIVEGKWMEQKTKKKGLVSKKDFDAIIESVDAKEPMPSKRKYTRRKKDDATSMCIAAKETADMLREISEETGEETETAKSGGGTVKSDDGSRLPEVIKEALRHEIAAITSHIAELTIDIERAKAKRKEIEEYLKKNT